MSANTPLTAALVALEQREGELVAELAKTQAAIAAVRTLTDQSTPAPRTVPVASPTIRRRTPSTSASDLSPLKAGKHGEAAARERGLALLRLILGGTHASSLLVSQLPMPPGVTTRQHSDSVRNALTRLKRDDLVERTERGWTATAKGRRAAAASAKEEP